MSPQDADALRAWREDINARYLTINHDRPGAWFMVWRLERELAEWCQAVAKVDDITCSACSTNSHTRVWRQRTRELNRR